MGKVPPRVPGRNAFPASPHGGAGAQVAHRSLSGVTVPNNVWTALSWTSDDATDVATAFDLSDPVDSFLQDDAWYQFVVMFFWTATGTGSRGVKLVGSAIGSNQAGDTRPVSPDESGGVPTWSHVTFGPVRVFGGSYMHVEAWQNSGGDLDVLNAAHLFIVKLP